ncbi:hypothetical protein Tco_0440743, partial [Tanacetum coccineum]
INFFDVELEEGLEEGLEEVQGQLELDELHSMEEAQDQWVENVLKRTKGLIAHGMG